MIETWLASPDNQESLQAISYDAIAAGAPEEMPVFEELFPRYVALAQEGDVQTGTDDSKAFGFADQAELLTLIVIPVLVEILAGMLVKQGLDKVADLKMSSEERETVEALVDEKLRERRQPPSVRRKLGFPIIESLINYLSGSQTR